MHESFEMRDDALGPDNGGGNHHRARRVDEFPNRTLTLVQTTITTAGSFWKEHHLLGTHMGNHPPHRLSVMLPTPHRKYSQEVSK